LMVAHGTEALHEQNPGYSAGDSARRPLEYPDGPPGARNHRGTKLLGHRGFSGQTANRWEWVVRWRPQAGLRSVVDPASADRYSIELG
jgi:hypothetical protein